MTNTNKAKDAISIADQAIDRQTGGAGEQTKAIRSELYSSLRITDDKIPAPEKLGS